MGYFAWKGCLSLILDSAFASTFTTHCLDKMYVLSDFVWFGSLHVGTCQTCFFRIKVVFT